MEDEECKDKFDYQVNDNVKDGEGQRFVLDFEDCKQSYKWKDNFTKHFKSHFTGKSTC